MSDQPSLDPDHLLLLPHPYADLYGMASSKLTEAPSGQALLMDPTMTTLPRVDVTDLEGHEDWFLPPGRLEKLAANELSSFRTMLAEKYDELSYTYEEKAEDGFRIVLYDFISKVSKSPNSFSCRFEGEIFSPQEKTHLPCLLIISNNNLDLLSTDGKRLLFSIEMLTELLAWLPMNDMLILRTLHRGTKATPGEVKKMYILTNQAAVMASMLERTVSLRMNNANASLAAPSSGRSTKFSSVKEAFEIQRNLSISASMSNDKPAAAGSVPGGLPPGLPGGLPPGLPGGLPPGLPGGLPPGPPPGMPPGLPQSSSAQGGSQEVGSLTRASSSLGKRRSSVEALQRGLSWKAKAKE